MMPIQTESLAPIIYNIRPVDGATCTIILESTSDISTDYPVGQEFTFVLGESDSPFGDVIEEGLLKLSTGKTCEIKFPADNSSGEPNIKLTLTSFQNRQAVCHLSHVQKLDIAKKHKEKGVELYKNDKLEYAFRRFSKAVKFLILTLPVNDEDPEFVTELNTLRVQCYSNMALCQMRFNRFDFVVENCSKALKLEPGNPKCLFRKAEACYKLGKMDECKVSCEEGLKVDPHSRSLQRLLERVEREFCDR